MSLRSDILAALRFAGPAGVSGEAIARESRVSRVAIAKHIAALREIGYAIDARPGEGYVLTSAPDLVIPAEVAPLLRDSLWVRVEGDVTVGSTNDEARSLAVAGAAEGTVVVASVQTAGRGRLGRQWESPAGGAYLSAVLRPPVAAIELAPLPLVIALG
ncbi:MAG TPA: HTH domain-containing protein, partial [Coriobacteriia bacterium]|nr:HTH domain-containing protein [Coriobacteriia bacterium]